MHIVMTWHDMIWRFLIDFTQVRRRLDHSVLICTSRYLQTNIPLTYHDPRPASLPRLVSALDVALYQLSKYDLSRTKHSQALKLSSSRRRTRQLGGRVPVRARG
jgi:hypothetical protein